MKTPLLAFPLALALVATGSLAGAQGFDAAQSKIDQRLEQSLRELAAIRDEIAAGKIPLSKQVSRLEDRVLDLREKKERLLELRDSRTIDLTDLRKQVDSLEEQEDFVNARLSEFVREFEGRLHISELARYEEVTAAAKLAEQNANLDEDGKRDKQLQVVRTALERLREQLGGQVFEGEALGPDGVLTRGRFVALGPTFYFASEDGSVSGLAENQLNAADPVVVPLPGRVDAGIAGLAQEGQGRLPFDATLGKALKKEKARKTLGQYVEDGGAVGYVILALAAAALLLTLFKLYEIVGFRVAEPEEVDGVLHEIGRGDTEGAFRRAEEVPGVAGEMLATGVQHAGEKREVLEEMIFDRVLRVRPKLERFLPFLAITAAAAPLLGLLGTVTGMIETFQLITIFGTGDAKSLSSGISEALVTTAMGLCVAIPTLIFHGALSRMARRKLGLLEQISVAFVNGVETRRRNVQL